MVEKVIEKKQAQKIVKKRIYSPPLLTVYGKLTDLTAGGTQTKNESTGHPLGLP